MQANGLTLRRFATPASAATALGRSVAQALAATPCTVLGLPTGRTPVPLYRALVDLYERGQADFSQASTFNLDEFLGVPPTDPRSYRAFMERQLFDVVNLRPSRVHFLNGAAPDAVAECARYERAIARAGGIDLLILGLGANGHIGFNEPGSALVAGTHRTRLTPATRRANASLFGRAVDVPDEALSMGMSTILRARRIVLLATGAAKAKTVRQMVCGPITPRVPASFLQLHRSAEVWVDREAAGELSAGAR